jgi:hypothetical protein
MSKRQKKGSPKVLTVDDVIAATHKSSKEDVHIVYLSSDDHHDRQVDVSSLLRDINRPETVERICRTHGWAWVSFGCVDKDVIYGIAKTEKNGDGKFQVFDWAPTINAMLQKHKDMFDRAAHERVTFIVTVEHPLHFPLKVVEWRFPHLDITAHELDDDLVLVAGPKGSLFS